MLEDIKKRVFESNIMLPKNDLVTLTWGNASEKDKETGYIVIKPSGIAYDKMSWEDMVIVDLTGKVIEGKYKPSSDTKTHIEIYKKYPDLGGIVHTHSRWATIFSQAEKDIPALGTTHADYFYGSIPCTRLLSKEEIRGDYEKETGKVIIETFEDLNVDPSIIPAILVAHHGPFVFGKDSLEAVEHSIILEQLAFMAYHNISLNPNTEKIQKELLEKNFNRKHGKDAYYGQ